MSTPFQNRLVGTVIVAAAIIIFLPDVLDGKKKSNKADFEAIPEAPSFTGKMTKKSFPAEDLVLKEKAIVFNEEAKDDQLQPNIVKRKENTNKAILANDKNSRVTPATKEKQIVSKTPSVAANNSAIAKPTLGQQPNKAINKEAWVIQLGSFKHKSNVAELVDKLKESGYAVFTKPIQTKKGTLTKVFVGPELIKSSLTKKLPALKTLTNVQGKVARFYPTK